MKYLCLQIAFLLSSIVQLYPESTISSGKLLGDILIYRAYLVSGNNASKAYGQLNSNHLSGQTFVDAVSKLSLDEQVRLYVVGKLVIPLDGESAVAFRSAFYKNRHLIKARIAILDKNELFAIFELFNVPKQKWAFLEDQIRRVR